MPPLARVGVFLGALAAMALPAATEEPSIRRVWLTHRSHDPSKVVVNWETPTPGDSVVRYGPTAKYGGAVRDPQPVTLHHVEIPMEAGRAFHFRVESGGLRSADAVVKGYPKEGVRLAVAADWLRKPDLDGLIKDQPHLLLTAGDHIPSLWESCGAGAKDCTKPFGALVERYAELFRTTPVMPVLGNHDREIRPRGAKPPPEPVYDIDATAYGEFFELPDEEWKWHFDLPEHGLRLIALDFNHIEDIGTTWQTCHPMERGSLQFEWYRGLMERSRSPYVLTLYNEKHSSIRSREQGAWHQMISRGTAAITGFGYFAERAEVDGFSYYNTSLAGKGDRYPDPKSAFLASEDNYLLITREGGSPQLLVEIKRLQDGQVLHRVKHQPRAFPGG